ncbi:hydrogenase expression/formation protein [Rubrivivax gelatinosus]|uniref:Hydrogenase-1 operon protein HyaF n=1 Tax=Rubrivivax gelatinosus TaxID=28068 RepID=A0A4R2M008_RUBGE|nr:hydrogenase expression/formation protein [Rubrivivax gelatinosus]MBK1688724.1 hydrogenase expression/formation protein [Rubrivivax gelatinosus]TCO98044.1 hydrogenase-1 operon protein HyaF [Rubrivivax gelatinosus]
MNAPISPRPFPIPLVAAGPGSHEDDGLDYLEMPQGMATYQAPRLPEPEQLGGHDAAVAALHQALAAVQACTRGETPAPVSLAGLSPDDLALVHQVLGEGEVSAQVLGDDGRPLVQVQESVFAGVWRVVEVLADGQVADTIECGPVPAVLLRAAREDGASPAPEPMAPPPGVMNAQSILTELAEQRHQWRAGQPAHVVNLTLLPLSPEDIGFMDYQIGTGRVVVLSRGYGNCRITDTRVPNTWRVVYYNSQDKVILNSVEVCAIPEVACAAPEDLADSAERLDEVLQWVAQG